MADVLLDVDWGDHWAEESGRVQGRIECFASCTQADTVSPLPLDYYGPLYSRRHNPTMSDIDVMLRYVCTRRTAKCGQGGVTSGGRCKDANRAVSDAPCLRTLYSNPCPAHPSLHSSSLTAMHTDRDAVSISRARSISRASKHGSTVSRSQSLIKKSIAPHDLRPSDILIERFTAWKIIVKQLIAYFEGIADIQNNVAREMTKLAGVIQVPFRSGNQFLGEGGLQVRICASY